MTFIHLVSPVKLASALTFGRRVVQNVYHYRPPRAANIILCVNMEVDSKDKITF